MRVAQRPRDARLVPGHRQQQILHSDAAPALDARRPRDVGDVNPEEVVPAKLRPPQRLVVKIMQPALNEREHRQVQTAGEGALFVAAVDVKRAEIGHLARADAGEPSGQRFEQSGTYEPVQDWPAFIRTVKANPMQPKQFWLLTVCTYGKLTPDAYRQLFRSDGPLRDLTDFFITGLAPVLRMSQADVAYFRQQLRDAKYRIFSLLSPLESEDCSLYE